MRAYRSGSEKECVNIINGLGEQTFFKSRIHSKKTAIYVGSAGLDGWIVEDFCKWYQLHIECLEFHRKTFFICFLGKISLFITLIICLSALYTDFW